MKILWICNIILPKIAEKINLGISNGGGWLTGLSEDLAKNDLIDLYIAFPHLSEKMITGSIENISYYSFNSNRSKPHHYNFKTEESIKQIINEVKPHIIHIFGTEFPHTLSTVKVCEELDLLDRTVVSLQGIMTYLSQHYYSGLSWGLKHNFTIRDILRLDNIYLQGKKFEKRGAFEREALKKVKFVIGRTDWDEVCSKLINPNLTYFHCNETLRSKFYENSWEYNKCEKNSIFVSQWSYPIKGFHYMIEAMPYLLKMNPNAHLYTTGESPFKKGKISSFFRESNYNRYIGKLIKKNKLQDKITFLGNLKEDEMCNQYLRSNVFVSPSVLENSPNSLGEAMLLGVPSIVSDVGGVKSMFNHNEDGKLYQHNAPYMLAYHINEVFNNQNVYEKISKNARLHALKTHDRDNNIQQLLKIYKEVYGLYKK